MSIPYRVQDYIADRGIPWDALAHEASGCSLDAAHLAHVAFAELMLTAHPLPAARH